MEIELGVILRTLRKWFWLPLVLMVALGGIAYFAASSQEKVYTATSTLVVELPNTSSDSSSTRVTASQLADPYNLLLDTESFRNQIAAEAGLPSIEGVEISVSDPAGSRFINVLATHSDPATALSIANATADVINADHQSKSDARLAESTSAIDKEIELLNADREAITAEISSLEASGESGSTEHTQLVGELNRLDQRIADSEARADRMRLDYQLYEPRLYPIKYEVPPNSPDNLSPVLVSFVGVFLGALVGLGFIVLWAALKNTISSVSEWSEHSDSPVLSEIPNAGALGEGGKNIFMLGQPTSAPSEGIRMLVTGLDFAGFPSDQSKVIQVTSPGPSEGKSTVSANLAVHMAQLGKRVLLVDCDLHRPRLHTLFNVPRDQGLTTLLMDKDARVEDLAARVALPGLSLLTSGQLIPNAAEAFSSKQFKDAIESFRSKFDVVILDTPPILLFSDTRRIASRADAMVAIGRIEQTKVPDMQQALEAISETGTQLMGTVWVGSKQNKSQYYYRERRRKLSLMRS